MLTPAQAETLIEQHLTCLPIESLPLMQAAGAVLRENIYAERDHPPFDRVAMDGIALSTAGSSTGRLRVVGMHLDLSGLWRKRQMRTILEAIADRPQKMPTVLMGDTNEWRTEAGCLRELNGEFHVAPTGPSFHARHPVAPLDRIIVHKDLSIEAAGVHMSAVARRASDHLPVWVRVSG